MQQVPPTVRVPLARRPVFWLVAAAALVLLVLGLVVGLAIVQGAQRAAQDAAPPSPSASQPAPSTDAAATPPAQSEPPAGGAGAVIPASCGEIYSRDWAADLGGLALNPPWTDVPGNGPFWGSNDTGAITVLEATTRLTCAWVSPSGGGDVGIITNLAELTPEQEASMADHLASIGHDCYAELDGTRCVIEWSTEAGNSGESHFLREGVWSATRWSNAVADGYTHDIVATVFG